MRLSQARTNYIKDDKYVFLPKNIMLCTPHKNENFLNIGMLESARFSTHEVEIMDRLYLCSTSPVHYTTKLMITYVYIQIKHLSFVACNK